MKKTENVHENRTSETRTTITIALSHVELQQLRLLAETTKQTLSKLLINNTLKQCQRVDN